jgi:hypothetical protein
LQALVEGMPFRYDDPIAARPSIAADIVRNSCKILSFEHDPRFREDRSFPKTGIYPCLRRDMLFGIML